MLTWVKAYLKPLDDFDDAGWEVKRYDYLVQREANYYSEVTLYNECKCVETRNIAKKAYL